MTLAELEKALANRGLKGVGVGCWDTVTPTWTAAVEDEFATGRTLSDAIAALLDKLPVLSGASVP